MGLGGLADESSAPRPNDTQLVAGMKGVKSDLVGRLGNIQVYVIGEHP